MKRHTKRTYKPDEEELNLLKDLERQSIKEIQKLRAHERLDITVNLSILPGNASQAGQGAISATTSDVSAGGCGAVSPVPLMVGDIYKVVFESGDFGLPFVFARCVRARLLREDAFEIALAFFTPISIDGPAPANKDLLD